MLPATEISDEEELYSFAKEQLCHRFSLAQIRLATQNFDDGLVIGKGGFGKVYIGYLNGTGDTTARLVAIKRLDSSSSQGASEFRAEIEMLSMLRHCHLVSLIGYCSDSKEMILVYEYMPNGTIEHHLHKAVTPLSWMHRLKISIGAARGLEYLHTGVGTQHGIIHRDVKSSNILLDENGAAKISDFGLSKIGPTNQPSSHVSTGIKGTFGYLDPEYYMTGQLTTKSDVYSFGVVLFELLSERHAVDERFDEEDWSLAKWAQKCVKERRLDQIVCSNIKGQISSKCLKEFAQIADRCLKSSRKDRPTMAVVVVALQQSMALQEQFDNSAQPAAPMGFIYKMQKYFATKNNSVWKKKKNKTCRYEVEEFEFEMGIGPKRFSYEELARATAEFAEKEKEFEFEMGIGPKRFSYEELARATAEFAEKEKLRKGGFGGVYKGFLEDSSTYVAVKRVSKSSKQGIREYLSEVKIIGMLRHRNLMKLTGWCHEKGELMLVYEYMENGSLDSYLFKGKSLLPWRTRREIAHGLAYAVLYLHNEGEKCVLHRHIKSSNVLLDTKFNAKLGDFGLAMMVDHEKGSHTMMLAGTLGYLAPECVMTRTASRESDVFSYGIVALEIACGRKVVNIKAEENHVNLVEWVWRLYETGNLLEAVDPLLGSDFVGKEIKRLMIVGLWCAHPDSSARPSMWDVIQVLKFGASLPLLPSTMPVVTYFPPPVFLSCDDTSYSSSSSVSLLRSV